jgi:hypothetical protein
MTVETTQEKPRTRHPVPDSFGICNAWSLTTSGTQTVFQIPLSIWILCWWKNWKKLHPKSDCLLT